MKGLRFLDNHTLAVRLAPLLPEFDRLWWWMCVQSFPLPFDWCEENEAILDRYFFDSACCKMTDASVWRPGWFSIVASHLGLDEWSYLIGFEAEESQVESKVCEIMSLRLLEREFFQRTTLYAAFMVDVDDNWFEFYSLNPQWIAKLAQHHARAVKIDSGHWDEWRKEQAQWIEELQRMKATE